jgi:DNA-binding NarL/FixJ family response regulator
MEKIKLLLVDDEEAWSDEFKTWLELTGEFEVETERFGVEAISHAVVFQPDVLLIDWALKEDAKFGLPGDGIALAHKIRLQEKSLDKAPIVIITKHSPEEIARHHGPNDEARGIFIAFKSSKEPRILARVGNALFHWTRQVK